MHALFLLSGLLLAVLVGAAGAGMLRLGPAGERRSLALAVLAAPLFVLALAGLHAAPWFWARCAPLVGWDRVVSIGIVLVIGLVAAGGLVLNLTRLLLVERLLASCPPIAGNAIAARVSSLSATLGIDPPALRLLGTDAPVAVTGGCGARRSSSRAGWSSSWTTASWRPCSATSWRTWRAETPSPTGWGACCATPRRTCQAAGTPGRCWRRTRS